jgi:hypothetical protein
MTRKEYYLSIFAALVKEKYDNEEIMRHFEELFGKSPVATAMAIWKASEMAKTSIMKRDP